MLSRPVLWYLYSYFLRFLFTRLGFVNFSGSVVVEDILEIGRSGLGMGNGFNENLSTDFESSFRLVYCILIFGMDYSPEFMI